MTTELEMHDVVVVGAGPGGLAAAIGLRRRGLSVAVVEREPRPRMRIGETAPPTLGPALRRLGVWAAFSGQRHLASKGSASAWATEHIERSDALCCALGAGWHLDRRGFEEALAAEAVRAGAELRRATNVVGMGVAEHGAWRVRTVGPGPERGSIAGRIVFDATGAAATVARWCGARRWIADRMICTHAVFATGARAGTEGRTLVEAAEEGWWYAAPLPGGQVVAAFFSEPRTVRLRRYAWPRQWHEALRRSHHVFAYVDRPPAPDCLHVSAVTQHCLDQAGGRDWLAVGDAACSFDPLSSAGITTAMTDGLACADAAARRLDGDRCALLNHAREAAGRFGRHQIRRVSVYRQVRRWPESRFWATRSLLEASHVITQERSDPQ